MVKCSPSSRENEQKVCNCLQCVQTFRAHTDLVFDGAVVEFCKRDERAGGCLGALRLSLSVALELSGATGQRAVLQHRFTEKRFRLEHIRVPVT